ncbi:MAG: hypothetical protein KDI89_14220, partial [Gammaproteobacteria bacterium]|nr:hypothetical protein [Gammaproteobacteria bacterium]
ALKAGALHQDQLIDLFAKVDPGELLPYFAENGYPVTELAFKAFGARFGRGFNFLAAQDRTRETLGNLDRANMERLGEIFGAVKDQLPSGGTSELLEKVAAGDRAAYIALRDLLLADREELQALLQAAKDVDQTQHTRWFDTLKTTLVAVDPGFQ